MTGATVTAARIIAGIGTVECSAVAASILTHRNGPIISRLPGQPLLWVAVFLVVAALLLFALTSGYPRAITFTFGAMASVHAAVGFALIAQGIFEGTGWTNGSFALLVAGVFAAEALRIARVFP